MIGEVFIAAATTDTTRDKLLVALIAAIGGLVGGFVSPVFQFVVEKGKTKTATRGIARVIAGQLGDVALTLEGITGHWPRDQDLTVDASEQDLKTLATQAESAFNRLADAQGHLKSVRIYARDQSASSQEAQQLISGALEHVKEAKGALEAVG